MKCLRYELQHTWQRGPPVGPGMAAVAYAEFMRYLFFTHRDMHKTISLIQKVIVAIINITAYFFLLVVSHILYQGHGAMLAIIIYNKRISNAEIIFSNGFAGIIQSKRANSGA